MDKLDTLKTKVDNLAFNLKASISATQTKRKKINELEHSVNTTEECIRLCQLCVDDRSGTKELAEEMLTNGLRRVFPEFDMRFLFEPVYNTDGVTLTGYKLVIHEHGVTQDVRYAHGFGVYEVICLLLRIIFLKMTDGLTSFILFDESLSFLNYSKYPDVIELIRELCSIEDIQIVFITNNKIPEEYITHFVSKSGKVSHVENRSEDL